MEIIRRYWDVVEVAIKQGERKRHGLIEKALLTKSRRDEKTRQVDVVKAKGV